MRHRGGRPFAKRLINSYITLGGGCGLFDITLGAAVFLLRINFGVESRLGSHVFLLFFRLVVVVVEISLRGRLRAWLGGQGRTATAIPRRPVLLRVDCQLVGALGATEAARAAIWALWEICLLDGPAGAAAFGLVVVGARGQLVGRGFYGRMDEAILGLGSGIKATSLGAMHGSIHEKKEKRRERIVGKQGEGRRKSRKAAIAMISFIAATFIPRDNQALLGRR